nr:OmpA family protein [uncultured Campylobacter sp.]
MKKVLLALSLCASGALFASDADYHWEITPTIGGMTHEGNMDLDSNFMFGLRLAKNLQDSFIDQVEVGFDYSRNIGVEDLAHRVGNDKPDAKYYHINVVKDLVNFTDNFKLYGLLGLGYMDYTKDVYNDGDQDSGFGQYGLGLKYYITDNFATKLEARDAIRFDDGNHVLFYTLGFAVDFGKRYADAAPAAAPAPTGCKDADNDGVCDNIDRCPGTPAGVVVDEYGCEKVIRLNLGVNFATDSSKISPEFMNQIKNVSDVLVAHPDYKVILEGHTDSTGSNAYNQKLSERRAAAVGGALKSFGVDASRITTVGYGETKPIATNATKAGRAQNRRVDAKFRK